MCYFGHERMCPMEEQLSPEVASFLIRIVQDQPRPDKVGGFRGLVRHIQTNEELNFTCWQEVEDFIQTKFPIEENNQIKGVDHEIEG